MALLLSPPPHFHCSPNQHWGFAQGIDSYRYSRLNREGYASNGDSDDASLNSIRRSEQASGYIFGCMSRDAIYYYLILAALSSIFCCFRHQ